MHEGHRVRMRKKISEVGADSLEPHELLEVFLYSSNARRNTNDIAHRLIEKFGSFAGVLDTDINELTAVDGVGPISAQQIKLLPAMFRAYGFSDLDGREKFDTLRAAGEYGIALFRQYLSFVSERVSDAGAVCHKITNVSVAFTGVRSCA